MTARELIPSLAILATMVACSREPSPPPAVIAPASTAAPDSSRPKPNLVLITMDTTRADHLGCYGDTEAETPNLDRLAAEGARFDRAIAVAPLTLPSHVSILTGLYPPRHGVRDDTGFTLPGSATTLAEHLAAQGYAAAATVGAHALASGLGLNQGFASYAEPNRGSRAAASVVDDAIGAINRMKGGPFFLWVHVYDPHTPYTPPPSFRERFAKRPYDGEIASVDAQLGRLFDHLRNQGLFDETVIVATADHGESLGEHGETTHGLFLYDTTLKVPLIVRYRPIIAAGTQVSGVFSGVDLAPTLLDLMRLPPMAAVQGHTLAAELRGESVSEPAPVYAESLFGERAFGWAPLHALRASRQKFVDAPEPELYDLARDPSETINIAANDAAIAGSWRSRLGDTMRAIGSADPNAAAAPAGRTSGRDPKGLVAASNLFLDAQTMIDEGDPGRAKPLLERALVKDPGNRAARSLLATLRGPAEVAAGDFASQWNLGNALFRSGKLDEAKGAFRAALAINPRSAETHFVLGDVLATMGDPGGAAKEYGETMRLGLRTPVVRTSLGSALLDSGDLSGAEAELRAAVDADPEFADGWNKLGIVLDKTERRPEALGSFSRALEVHPDHADALFNRAKIELLENDLTGARRDVDRLLATHGDYAAGRFLEAHLCVAEGNESAAKSALTKFLALPRTEPRMKAAAQEMLGKLGG